jgi:hypothetical protein
MGPFDIGADVSDDARGQALEKFKEVLPWLKKRCSAIDGWIAVLQEKLASPETSAGK